MTSAARYRSTPKEVYSRRNQVFFSEVILIYDDYARIIGLFEK